MRQFAFRLLLLFFCTGAHAAAPVFPPLTGHVVDQAHILSADTARSLEQTLQEYERGTTNQIVVVTLPSLGGLAIEDYGYRLGRFWELGVKGKNNGALLLVAVQERKARIEVGYGLEPVLTDAMASRIINAIVVPDFREGDMNQGVSDGVNAMLQTLGGEGKAVAPHEAHDSAASSFLSLLLLILFFGFAVRHPFLAAFLLSNTSRFGGGGSDSDNFHGGGGSFGGGGASGSW